MRNPCCVAAIALLLAAPACAEEAKLDPPDPATVVVPDLAFKPTKRDPHGYWEYFVFHKAGVSYPKAFADLTECAGNSRYLVATGPIPKFVALGGDASQTVSERGAAYTTGLYQPGTLGNMVEGLVVPIIFAIAINSVNHGVERANTRRCMAYKGYKRYGLNSKLWDKLNEGKEPQITARLALIASAPTAPAEEIDP